MINNYKTTIKKLLIHLSLAFISLIIFIYIISLILDNYTDRKNLIKVPPLTGINISNAKTILQKLNLNYKIIDSAYTNLYSPATIIEQDPLPNTNVKKNRTIYLTIAAHGKEKTTMPNLINLSLRQATEIIKQAGLKLGNIKYVEEKDIKNFKGTTVIKQYYKGKPIKENTIIYKNEIIDITVSVSPDIIDSLQNNNNDDNE